MTIGGIKMKFQVKYLFLILIIATIFPLSIKSQSTFMKFFGADGRDNDDMGYTVLQTDDGGFIAGGVYNQHRINNTVWSVGDNFIVRINKDGETLWTKTYGDPSTLEKVTAIFKSNEGEYLVFYLKSESNYLSLMKINSEGDSIWNKDYQFKKDHWEKSIKQTKDSGFVIVGTNKTSRDILKLDSEGNELWEKSFDSLQSNFECTSIAETIDNGYIISTISHHSEIQSTYIMLIKTDDSLNIQWKKEYPPTGNFEFGSGSTAYGYEVFQTSDGGYFSIGSSTRRDSNPGELYARGWLIKTDSNGDTLWTKLTGLQNYLFSTRLYTGLEDSDRNLVVAGDKQSHFLYIIKLKPDGTIIWEKELGIYTELELRGFDIKETNDGGYIITGDKTKGSLDYQDLFLMKVNKDGILVSVKSEEKTIPTNFELSQNYPNPFNPTTTMNYTIPKGGNVRLEIYNSLGEIVNILQDSYQDAGNHSITWTGKDSNGNSLSSGIYFYRLVSNDFVQVKKMTFLK
jgi:hypothetical protein